MFQALLSNPDLAPLLPYARTFYGRESRYVWFDDHGVDHTIHQGEGVEQGDALSPALFSLALNLALVEANAALEPGEALIAYLDDVYILTRPERARAAFDAVTRVIEDRAGIRSNMGKCACWHARGGEPPPGIAELGGPDDRVWRGDGAAAERGLIILGNPVGTADFILSLIHI